MHDMEEVLKEYDADIRRLARAWSRDSPDTWEDLAQEARLGIYQELREKPNSPRHHLFRRAKHEILDYRKRGKSVDGKLDKTYKRKFVWQVDSADAQPSYDLGQLSPLHYISFHQKPVEELALARVSYSELQQSLSDTECHYLSLLLEGYQRIEARQLLNLTKSEEVQVRKTLQDRAREVLCLNGYSQG